MSILVSWTVLIDAAADEKTGEPGGLSVGVPAATTVHKTTGAITDEPNMSAPRKLNPKPP
jgi:hypothetical protein